MLDKLKGNKGNSPKNDGSSNLKNPANESGAGGGKFKGLVGRKSNDDDGKSSGSRPMPKPRMKSGSGSKLGAGSGSGGNLGQPKGKGSNSNTTMIGAIVIIIVIVGLGGAGWYFAIYQPAQESLNQARTTKIAELDTYFSGALADSAERTQISDEINSASSASEVEAIDIKGKATPLWKTQLTKEVKQKKDSLNRVMIKTNSTSQIMTVSNATNAIKQLDADALSQINITQVDTVAVPIQISRVQTAGGLIAVGNTVDIYLKVAETPEPSPVANETNDTAENNTSTEETANSTDDPVFKGSTVLAILRQKDSGVIGVNVVNSKSISTSTMSTLTSSERTNSKDMYELLKAASAGGFSPSETSTVLTNYGIKLSNYERRSNLGDLDVNYIVLLEVPREEVTEILANQESIVLTIPTLTGPNWLKSQMNSIYRG